MGSQTLEYRDHPTINPRNTNQLRKLIERRRAAYLWSQKSIIIPRLVDQMFGDGKRLLALLPIMYRPERFVIRVGSNIDIEHCGTEGDDIRDILDDIYEAIEEEYYEWPWARKYGRTWHEDENADMDSRIDWSGGSCWHEMKWPVPPRNKRTSPSPRSNP